jgi:hypothetical protein
MTTIVWIALAAGSVYGLHRLALWMEARGWIYYRKKHGSSGGLGAAFLEMQSLLEPSKRHVLEVKRNEDAEDDDSGDPPSPDVQSESPDQRSGSKPVRRHT